MQRLDQMTALWQQVQSVHVLGADDGEVAPIQAGHVSQIQPFGHRDDGRVYGAQREVGVGTNEFGGSRQVGSGDGDVLEPRLPLPTPGKPPRRRGVLLPASRPRRLPWSGSGAGRQGTPAGRRSVHGAYQSGRWPQRAGRCRKALSRGALHTLSDDLVMPFGEIAAPGIPDPDDRQPPGGYLLAFRPGGGREFRIGCYKDAQPFRLGRGEPVDQVVQVLVVVRRRHNQSLRPATLPYWKRQS